MHKILKTPIGIILPMLLCLGAGRAAPAPKGPTSKPVANLSPAALQADASTLKGTIVTAALDEPMTPGKNILWCGSFQLAWNELVHYAGGPISMTDPPALLKSLNRQDLSRTDIDPASVLAIAGQIGDGVLANASRELSQRFPSFTSRLLPVIQGFEPDAVMAYALLAVQMRFQYAFNASVMEFNAGGEGKSSVGIKVKSFGIEEYDPENPEQAPLARQVRILWHESLARYEQHFIVELLTQARDERLILAQVPPKGTLGQTVAEVMQRLATPNTLLPPMPLKRQFEPPAASEPADRQHFESKYACLLPGEHLYVPVVDFDISRDFLELTGKTIQAKNPKLDGMPLVLARQQTHFRLDRTGAALRSESVVVAAGLTPRNFFFRDPFLILLLHKGSSQPYFALWVGNTELLTRAHAVQEGEMRPQ